jgi:hypothetical protein
VSAIANSIAQPVADLIGFPGVLCFVVGLCCAVLYESYRRTP